MTILRLLYALWQTLACAAHGDAVGRLGYEAYPARVAAADSLRAAGWRAYPALSRGLAHRDPEVRHACSRLLKPLDADLAELRALWLLVGPGPDPRLPFADDLLRQRLARRCEAWWPGDSGPFYLDPANDPGAWQCWLKGHPFVWTGFAQSFDYCRLRLQFEGFWPTWFW